MSDAEDNSTSSDETGDSDSLGDKKSTDNPKEEKSLLDRLRGPKLNGMAAFDFAATAAAALFISKIIKLIGGLGFPVLFVIVFIILIIIGIAIHYFMGIPTMLNHYLGLNTLQEVMESRNK